MAKKLVAGHLCTQHDLYYMVLSLPDPNTGKKKPTWFPTGLKVKGNKTLANKMLQKARKNATKGILPPRKLKQAPESNASRALSSEDLRSNMLFSDYILFWLEANRTTWEETTYSSYYGVITRKIAPYFAEKKIALDKLTTVDIQGFYSSCKQKGNSGNTILHYHANVRKSLADAVRKFKLIPVNPAADVTRPKIDNFVSNYYDAAQLISMLEAFRGSSIELPVALAAYYGFRRSEALGLKWSAIDFKNGTITVSHTVSRVKLDGETRLITKNRTKNKSSFRFLPLIPQVKQMLLQARETQKQNQRLCGKQYNTDYLEYICVNSMGRIIYPDTVSQGFSERIKKLDMPHIRFHDLRHSCASLLLANGISLKEIQLWLGHSNFATTANIYAHLDMSSKQSSASTIAQCLVLTPLENKKRESSQSTTAKKSSESLPTRKNGAADGT